MSNVSRALGFGAVGAVDVVSGALVGSFVELFAPPITTQSPIQMFVEGIIQTITVFFLSMEASQLINRLNESPTSSLPFLYGVFIAIPNTTAKLTTSVGYARQMIKGMIFPGVQTINPSSAAVPLGTPSA